MQQQDEVVSGWLNGSDLDNPAGPLFLDNAEILMANVKPMITGGATTASCRPQGGCACC